MYQISEDESVIRNGEKYSIGDKVYSKNRAKFGVGEVLEIKLMGVGLGFSALVDSCILSSPKWYDARCVQKQMPEKYQHFKHG